MFQKIKKNYKPLLLTTIILGLLSADFYYGSKKLERGVPTQPDLIQDITNDGLEDAIYIMNNNTFNQNFKCLSFIDGKNLSKAKDGTYLTHVLQPIKINGTDFIPKTNYKLMVIAGNFNNTEGIDFEVSEILPDRGSNITHKFYDIKSFRTK